MSPTMRLLLFTTAAAVLLCGLNSTVRAQAVTERLDCDATLSRSRGRAPSQLTAADVRTLAECGLPGHQALAALVRRGAAESSDDVLMNLIVNTTAYDPIVFAAGADLASNRAATRIARVAGLRILLHQTAGWQFLILNHAARGPLDPTAFVDSTSGCTLIGSGQPNPVARSQLFNVAMRLNADPDVVVRNLARCIDVQVGPPAEARLSRSDVSFRPVCSLTFNVRTTSPRTVTLDWVVTGTTENGVVTIPPGKTIQLSVEGPGQVVISFQERELARAQTIGTQCP